MIVLSTTSTQTSWHVPSIVWLPVLIPTLDWSSYPIDISPHQYIATHFATLGRLWARQNNDLYFWPNHWYSLFYSVLFTTNQTHSNALSILFFASLKVTRQYIRNSLSHVIRRIPEPSSTTQRYWLCSTYLPTLRRLPPPFSSPTPMVQWRHCGWRPTAITPPTSFPNSSETFL